MPRLQLVSIYGSAIDRRQFFLLLARAPRVLRQQGLHITKGTPKRPFCPNLYQLLFLTNGTAL